MTLATIPFRELSNHQRQMFEAGESDTLAEEIVADVLGPNAKHRPDRADWFDVVRETTGTKTEVKSTLTRIGDAYPADGRFRLRRDQTRSLTASASSGAAWYAFVLFDLEAGVVRIRRARPSTVSRWVRERGGWNEAGHAEFDWQHKLPYSVVF